jgi:peptidoglycan/LPS O-acetylase OafA/YrhL
LIVIYHIWLNRVSGGVDVFFLLSGFLITASLMRSTDRGGRVQFALYYARIARRIFPPALFALVGVVVLTVVWLPQTRWRDTLSDVLAAATYTVNWRLAENAVDYLAAQNAASPVQHYWSLAVQAQFYLVWPLLIALAAVVSMRLALPARRVLTVTFGAVLVMSLGYSVYRTDVDQAYTYFDTLARVWEFALGGLLLLALPHLRVNRLAGLVLGWLALVSLIACGVVLRAGDEFPGYAALWPTLAACLLIVTAGGGHRLGADRVLRSGPLRQLGALSYALYLWHWPVLVCYLAATGRTVPSGRGGLLVIGASLLLATATKWLLEDRLPRSGIGQRTVRGAFALAAASLCAVLMASIAWSGILSVQQRRADGATELITHNYPGAAYLMEGGILPDVPYRPGPLRARDDAPEVQYPGCAQNQRDSEPVVCAFGPADAERTVALVGGSHALHWLPALYELGDLYGWRILSITKSACLFSADVQYRGGEPYTTCNEWNDKVLRLLAELRPDAVFTNSTRVTRSPEVVPDGYVGHWRSLGDMGITVLGIRDTPRPWIDVPECVEVHGPDAPACGHRRDVYGLDQPDAASVHADLPANVILLDLTHLFCPDETCPAVIGNVLVYHDPSHISVSYARTLAPFLGEAIREATRW